MTTAKSKGVCDIAPFWAPGATMFPKPATEARATRPTVNTMRQVLGDVGTYRVWRVVSKDTLERIQHDPQPSLTTPRTPALQRIAGLT